MPDCAAVVEEGQKNKHQEVDGHTTDDAVVQFRQQPHEVEVEVLVGEEEGEVAAGSTGTTTTRSKAKNEEVEKELLLLVGNIIENIIVTIESEATVCQQRLQQQELVILSCVVCMYNSMYYS